MNWYIKTSRNQIESIANRLSSEIFIKLKEQLTIRRTDGIQPVLMAPKNIPNVVKTKINVYYRPYIQRAMFLTGGYFYDDNYFMLKIYFRDQVFNPKDYPELSFRLKDLIRHELEHTTQAKPEKNKTQAYIIDGAEEIKNYLISQPEVEAYVAGLYFEAKKRRVQFTGLLEEFWKNRVMTTNMDLYVKQELNKHKEEVFNIWMNYARKRYPKLQ